MIRSKFAVLALLASSACSSTNIPISTAFPVVVGRPTEARVFVDANGTFYPDNWPDVITASRIKKSGSLLNAATPDERRALAAEEERQLATLAAIVANKSRVFVLIHGYNNDETDASTAFDLLVRRINPRPDDAVIRLHWDGLLGTGIGAGAVWFPASGYSQVVGIRALRRILNLPRNQDIYLISHSRGASVVLSAVGDPPFAPGFRAKTEEFNFAGSAFLNVPLENRGNRIHAILLAPAVGYPDFWDRTCEPQGHGKGVCADPPAMPAAGERLCPQYRAFTPELKSISYTTNAGDRTLRKYAGKLRRYFNATDLGYDPQIGQRLATCFAFPMKGYAISKPHPHAFTLYAQDPEVGEMLQGASVGAR